MRSWGTRFEPQEITDAARQACAVTTLILTLFPTLNLTLTITLPTGASDAIDRDQRQY